MSRKYEYRGDEAADRVARMWKRLAISLEKLALNQAEKGYPELSVQTGKFAEASWWQFTGDSDTMSFKETKL